MAIIEAAVAFNWRTRCVFIERRGDTSIRKNEAVHHSTNQHTVGSMFQCQAIGGCWGNGTNKATLEQMDKMRYAL